MSSVTITVDGVTKTYDTSVMDKALQDIEKAIMSEDRLDISKAVLDALAPVLDKDSDLEEEQLRWIISSMGILLVRYGRMWRESFSSKHNNRMSELREFKKIMDEAYPGVLTPSWGDLD